MRLWQREQSAHDLSVINHPKAQRYRACSTMRHHTIRVRVGPREERAARGGGNSTDTALHSVPYSHSSLISPSASVASDLRIFELRAHAVAAFRNRAVPLAA